MRIEKKLHEWVEAGLLTGESAAAIGAYEQTHKRPTFLLAFAGLGALAVAIGIVSIVAANWEKISPHAKLGADLFVGIVLAVALYIADRKNRGMAREALLVIFWGYVIASVSLIAQVYNLATEPYRGLLAWMLVTTPVMLLARTRFTAFLFVSGWVGTFIAMAELVDDYDAEFLVYPSLPFLLLLLGKWLAHLRRHDNLRWALEVIGWAGIVGGATAMQQAWYASGRPLISESLSGLFSTLLLTAVFVTVGLPREYRVAVGGFLVTAIALAFAPFLAGGDVDLFAAFGFLILWSWIAWLGHSLSKAWLYNLAIGLLALRILIIYFEVFGSLLSTGIGLVIGGLLTLVLGWLFSRWSIRSSTGGSAPMGLETGESDA